MRKIWIIMTVVNGYKNIWDGSHRGLVDFFDNEEAAQKMADGIRSSGFYDEVYTVPMWG